jgi:hypothetical protein
MTSTIKVNNIQNQCGANIINENSNTITIGASGDTIALASGASQSGFGRTGTVDWQTTPKTGDFTAANGEGYFVNTTSGAVVMTMPSGSAGAIVSIQDYNKTFDSNSLTITPASGERINGGSVDGDLIISTEGQGLTFVYVDATVGWKTVQDNEFTTGGSSFIIATGGTITTSGNCKIHTFTGPGSFAVSSAAASAANNVVSYLVVAGGGGGSNGGGGAGGFREFKSPVTPYTASPLVGSTPITVTAASFPVTVGAGGAGNADGNNSVFAAASTITSAGGGSGGTFPNSPGSQGGANGGSGGGGGGGPNPGTGAAPGGTGNTPPVSPPQGNPGGAGRHVCGAYFGSGGGGGATAAGASKTGAQGDTPFGNGGAGATTSINGSPTAFAGGGGAADNFCTGGTGGTGGGGAGPSNAAGGTNTGGGGGGSGAGGSGIVIIRYKFQ